jgi:hypothetical protein
MNRSQKQECRNWDSSHAIPFLGIFVSNFRYCVFALRTDKGQIMIFLGITLHPSHLPLPPVRGNSLFDVFTTKYLANAEES